MAKPTASKPDPGEPWRDVAERLRRELDKLRRRHDVLARAAVIDKERADRAEAQFDALNNEWNERYLALQSDLQEEKKRDQRLLDEIRAMREEIVAMRREQKPS